MRTGRRLTAALTVLLMLFLTGAAALGENKNRAKGEVEVSFYARKNGKLLYTWVTDTNGKLTRDLRSCGRDGYVFMGWYTHPYQGTRITDKTVFKEDTRVWAHWGWIEGGASEPPKPGVYTVTFREDDDSRTLPASLQTGEDGRLTEVPLPSAEKRRGLKFLCWRDRSSKKLITAETVFTGNATAEAVWGTIGKASLTYMSDGCVLASKAYPKGDWVLSLMGRPEEKNNQKRQFLGWYTGETDGKRVTSLFLEEDTVLYAHWSEPGWKITFTNAFALEADGTNIDGNRLYTGPDGKLPEIPQGACRGARFLGWYTDQKCTVPLTEDTVFRRDTRVWAKTEKTPGVKISLNASQYGHFRSRSTPEVILVREDGTPGPLPKAVWFYNGQEQREFLGWFTADNQPVTAETVFTKDTVIYAKWKPGYRISFASSAGPSYKTAYTDGNGRLTSLPAMSALRKGTPALGWYTKGGEKVTPDTVFTADTELVPKWPAVITFIVDRKTSWGAGRVADIGTDENGRLLYLPSVSHPKGYPFAGWTDEKGRPVDANTVFTADGKVFGTWETEGNQIAFVGGHGGNPDVRMIRTHNDGTVDALPSAHHKNGLPFRGWSRTEDGSSPVTADEVFSAPVTTLYASWIPAYKVTFRPRGGTVAGGASAVRTDENGYVADWPEAEHPLKLRFGGWFAGPGANAEPVGPQTRFLKDSWVDAHWLVTDVPAGGFTVTLADRSLETKVYTTDRGQLKNLYSPKRKDAVFHGWYTGPAATGEKVRNGTRIGADMTFYAAWLIPLTAETDR